MKKTFFGFAMGICCSLLLANTGRIGAILEPAISDSVIDCASLQIGELCPVQIARQWKANYQNYQDSLLKAAGQSFRPFASAFTFQTNDLLVALGIPTTTKTNYRHVRGYFGIDENGNSKIFFVGVDGADFKANIAGTDIFFSCSKQQNNDQEFVLDLNYPCPTLCPTDPLAQHTVSPMKKRKKK